MLTISASRFDVFFSENNTFHGNKIYCLNYYIQKNLDIKDYLYHSHVFIINRSHSHSFQIWLRHLSQLVTERSKQNIWQMLIPKTCACINVNTYIIFTFHASINKKRENKSLTCTDTVLWVFFEEGFSGVFY